MNITASLVKELRERTGAGMMDCKKALNDTNGDIEAAIEVMRKSGAAKAAKKAGRIAAEGIISIKQKESDLVILEVNCETDFVAKDENFLSFAETIIEVIIDHDIDDVNDLLKFNIVKQTVEEMRQQLIAKIGEKITIRRFEKHTFKQYLEKIDSSGKVVNKILLPVKTRYLYPEQVITLCEKSGLTLLNYYGDFNYGEINENSDDMVFICTK